MQVIIYGKDNCINCDKTRMLCQIQSIAFQYLSVGTDISEDELHHKVGHAVRSLPQIFIQREAGTTHVGGYEALRIALRLPH
ncbi:glutaredoxin domain-containing protein [Thermomonas paludicola]|uniref:glutaredoxin domain-containing protein n=1 Tax=Thermomonas paludicola TaxID=2884874 RepID=UPI002114E302|nr:glutaredoxin domain-containing protein [Thermomonas paludicola]